MKTIRLIIFLQLIFFSTIGISQIRPDYYKKDFEEQYTYTLRKNAHSGFHKYLVEIMLNNSMVIEFYIQEFLQHKMGYSSVGDMKFEEIEKGYVKVYQKYAPKIQYGDEVDKYLEVIYTYYELDDMSRIVVSYEFIGYYSYVMDFFITYWPTTVNTETVDRKSETTSNYIEDIAIFKFISDNKASITMKNRKYINYKEFIKEVENGN